jgi:hypothetical protein
MPSWKELPHSKPVIEERLPDLSASFREYVEVFLKKGPFSDSQLRSHLRALEARASFSSAADALSNSDFAVTIRDVLRDWGVGTRGSELVPIEVFRAELQKIAARIGSLEQLRIDDVAPQAPEVASRVWSLIDSMCLVTKDGKSVRNRVVSGSKALHHVLPKLVFPIDREYTQTFFGWHNPEFQNNPRDCFALIFVSLADVANKIKPTHLVGTGWMSSPAKILDNAIVGYCVKHGLKSENTVYQQKNRALYNEMKKHLKDVGMWNTLKAEAGKKGPTGSNS